MSDIKELLSTIVKSIVDDEASVLVSTEESEKGLLFEVRVGKDDVGKVIGKQGRIANAIRTVMKAAGAKQGVKLMVNVFNKPVGSPDESGDASVES